MLLGILPFVGLFVCVWTFANALGGGSWRHGVLRAVVLWGLYAILSLELLSLFTAVTRPLLLAVWAIPVAGILGYKALEFRRVGKPAWSFHWLTEGILGKILALTLLFVILITALVAWLTPPNTWDSLNYHMPRVAHWAQLQAVRHFATGIEIQNSMPPASEMMILHTYVLAQGDRWANFIAWIAVWFGVLGVTFITKELGAGKAGQWLAGAFAASLPTAIIQASSTMTDAVTGLWVIVVAVETVPLLRGQQLDWRRALFMGAAAGLAILTKPIAFAYLLPFALYIAFKLMSTYQWREAASYTLLALSIVLLINAGHWVRNQSLYGNPVSQPRRIEAHRSPWLGGRALLSNLVRNVTMHAATPSPHINKGITLLVQEFHQLLELDVNDPRTTATGIFKIRWGETNEDKATNPIHTYFLVAVLVGMVTGGRQKRIEIKVFALLSASTLIVFSLLFQWQLYAGRYHLPFFMLLSAPFGAVVEDWLPRDWLPLLPIGLILFSWPWMVQIKSRPLIPDPQESYIGSVVTTPRRSLYLANVEFMDGLLDRFSEVLDTSQCRRYGLALRGSAPEYLWWVWLTDLEGQATLQWIVEGTPSAKLAPQDSEICAVICRDCSRSQAAFRDLKLVEFKRNFNLYLATEGP